MKVVEQKKIKNKEHMYDIHNELVSQGAEGTIIRKPNSYYENKRSNTLLKLKNFYDDEVKVIGYELGEGRNLNRLGALNVKWVNPNLGTNVFNVGSGFTDYDRINYKTLFPLNTIITIKYFEIDNNSKRPRFPTFWRIKTNE